MAPLLEKTLSASNYAECERWLARAYELAGDMHNALGITLPVESVTRTYAGWHAHFAGGSVTAENDTRPYQVIFAGRFEQAIRAVIRDPLVLALMPDLGSVNQILTESSNALQNVAFTRRLRDDLVA